MLGIIGYIFIYIADTISGRSKNMVGLLHEQADKRSGTVRTKPGRSPRLQFLHNGCQVTVETPVTSRFMTIRAFVEGTGLPTAEVIITKKTSFPNLFGIFKHSEFSSGDAMFDMWYTVRGASEYFMKKFVNNEVRRQLLNTNNRNVVASMEITPQRLIYEQHQLPESTKEYDSFIDAALFITDWLLLLRREMEVE